MIAIIDYDAGNLASVARAVRHLGFPLEITRDPQKIRMADRVIFPGVGAAGSAMESMKKYGLDTALGLFAASGRPVLGICLGTQIILGHSQENNATCLGLLKGEVRAFDPRITGPHGERLKIPHMGWNNVCVVRPHPVLAQVRPEHQFYFVHGYYPVPESGDMVFGESDYGIRFASVIGKDNLIATQFHPEKSGEPGLAVLKNFCAWTP